MIGPKQNIRLLIAFLVLLLGTLGADVFYRKRRPLRQAEEMHAAAELAQDWFYIVRDLKEDKGVKSDAFSNVANSFMIGDEWSDITSSLGSLEAKEISTNPDFAALIVRFLNEAGLKKGDRVGLILSGSFPSLAISSLAALQTTGMEAIVMSSLGASTYGANQPEVTWIDMEKALIRRGGLEFESSLVSMGADNDNGYGLFGEGPEIITRAAERNNIELYIPGSLVESIKHRVEILNNSNISLLINIGGNQASMGNCSHTLGIPNGLNKEMTHCNDSERGVISRMNEAGIPFVNMLNMKDLSSRYGIDGAPGIRYSGSTNLYSSTTSNKLAISIILLLGLIPIWFLRNRSAHIK
ncbi:MAG: poly-gamma-glutamate system protein [Bacteroidales bacterium]|nr:poly-gamma-glutamate system protein [Bacteroidales bacterium]